MGSIVGVLETQVRASTQDFERGMERAERKTSKFGSEVSRIGARSAAAFGQAMSAVAASSAAAEKNWVSLGATILGSFAVGGPIAGGIAVVAAGVGLLIGKTKDAETSVSEYAKAWEEVGKKAAASAAKVAEELDKAQIALGAPDLSARQIRIARLGVEIENTEEELRVRRLKEQQIEERLRRSEDIDEIMALVVAMKKAGVETGKAAEALGSMKDEMRDLVALAEMEADARERSAAAAAALAQDPRVRWLRSGRAPLSAGGPFSGSSPGFTPADELPVPFADLLGSDLLPFPEDDRQARWDADKKRIEDAEHAITEAMEAAERQARQTAAEIAAPFHDAFAAAIVDGARTGFKNLEQIGEALFANWLSMAARALSQRLFGGVFDAIAGVGGGAGGGGSVLQILPVAIPAETVNAGIQSSGALQSTINVVGSQVMTLEQYRAGR